MNKLLLSVLIFVGLVATAQAGDKKSFKIINNTGSSQFVTQCIISGSMGQTIAQVDNFSLPNGGPAIIISVDTPDSSFFCQMQIGEYEPANIITPSPDIYQLQYNAELNFMTLTKE